MAKPVDDNRDLINAIQSLRPSEMTEVLEFIHAIKHRTDHTRQKIWHDGAWGDTVDRIAEIEQESIEDHKKWLAAMKKASKPAHYDLRQGIVIDN